MNKNKLTPEQDRALDVCINGLNNFNRAEIIPVSHLQIEQVSIENTKLFVDGRVNRKSLPHELGWLWNQTKSKVEVKVNDNERVIMAKFNPRKHPKSGIYSQPSYKLWVCQIISKTKSFDSQLNFLWVEKGKKDIFAPAPLVKKGAKTIQQSPELKLSDFSFLGEFVSPEVAFQLGWDTPNSNFSPESSFGLDDLETNNFFFDYETLLMF